MARSLKTLDDLYRHAKKRAAERYQLFLDWQSYQELIAKIRAGKCFSLGRESSNRTHFLIDDQYIVVYDKSRGGISTFLPPEAIHNYLPLINGKVRPHLHPSED